MILCIKRDFPFFVSDAPYRRGSLYIYSTKNKRWFRTLRLHIGESDMSRTLAGSYPFGTVTKWATIFAKIKPLLTRSLRASDLIPARLCPFEWFRIKLGSSFDRNWHAPNSWLRNSSCAGPPSCHVSNQNFTSTDSPRTFWINFQEMRKKCRS